MHTGLGKYRSEGRHRGRYVVVVLHNNFYLYKFDLCSFPSNSSTPETWTFSPVVLNCLNDKVFLDLLIFILALGPNYYL
jgi:hypothetical protein